MKIHGKLAALLRYDTRDCGICNLLPIQRTVQNANTLKLYIRAHERNDISS